MDATTGALIVAGLSVLMTPITAWLTFRWGRDQERERLAAERAAEEARWQREERTRRVVRGEEAAGRLLELVDDATADFKDDQAAFRPTYIEMRRQAELLTDDATRDRLFQVAAVLYYAFQARQADQELTNSQIGSTAADAAHEVIRAYLHERPLPDLPRFDKLRALKDQGGQMLYDEMREEEPWRDPLADPEGQDDPE